MDKIDREEYKKRLDRITELFSGMVAHADAVSQTRCPYRDRHDHCTAKFRCRNQARPETAGDATVCLHDGRFDYRTAWETDPEADGKARRRIERIKDAAAERRGRTSPK